MKDKDIAEAIGLLPTSFSAQYRNSKDPKKRLKYLFLKVGADLVVDGTVDYKKIDALKIKLGVDA